MSPTRRAPPRRSLIIRGMGIAIGSALVLWAFFLGLPSGITMLLAEPADREGILVQALFSLTMTLLPGTVVGSAFTGGAIGLLRYHLADSGRRLSFASFATGMVATFVAATQVTHFFLCVAFNDCGALRQTCYLEALVPACGGGMFGLAVNKMLSRVIEGQKQRRM